MKIAIDMMGGDFAPLEAVKGLQIYLSMTSRPATIFCLGNEAQLKPLFELYNIGADNVKIIHAPEEIGYHEPPTRAFFISSQNPAHQSSTQSPSLMMTPHQPGWYSKVEVKNQCNHQQIIHPIRNRKENAQGAK